MAIIRLGVATPAADTDQQLAAVLNTHLVSVIIANKSQFSSPQCKVTIWVVPANANQPSDYAYIASSLVVGVGQSFETFRFAVNAGDSVFVRSTTAETSFSLYGILQSDDVGPADLPLVFRNKTLRGINNTLYLDKGTTAQRQAGAEVGYVRFNTDFDALEVKTEQGWRRVAFE